LWPIQIYFLPIQEIRNAAPRSLLDVTRSAPALDSKNLAGPLLAP
jgi:hypothetical protein